MERYKKSNKDFNTKMKKGNQKKHYCITTRIWPSVEKMNKDLLIDLENQKVTNLSTGKVLKQRINNEGYVIINFIFKNVSRTLRLHRLFFYSHHGYLPELVDHKDRNPQNNKINNLRELDDSQNAMNSNKRKSYKNKSTTSIYKGVYWNKQRKKWRASLMFKGKYFHLGSFDNEDDAGQAYNDKIRELGLEEVSVMNYTPQERARKLSLFDNLEPITDLK
jgi:hypothetical protein